jgi:hypothetical protein
LRTHSSAALAKLVHEEVYLWCAESDATSPQPAEDMRLILSAGKTYAQAAGQEQRLSSVVPRLEE